MSNGSDKGTRFAQLGRPAAFQLGADWTECGDRRSASSWMRVQKPPAGVLYFRLRATSASNSCLPQGPALGVSSTCLGYSAEARQSNQHGCRSPTATLMPSAMTVATYTTRGGLHLNSGFTRACGSESYERRLYRVESRPSSRFPRRNKRRLGDIPHPPKGTPLVSKDDHWMGRPGDWPRQSIFHCGPDPDWRGPREE